MVKPMPASTCWQCRATVRAARPAKALAMAAVTGEGSSQAASSSAAAASRATRLSARRWRTAWKVAIGRPNWMRSSACGGPARAWPAPTPPARGRGRAAPAPRRRPSRPLASVVGGRHRTRPSDLDQARAPDRAAHGLEREVGRLRHERRQARRRSRRRRGPCRTVQRRRRQPAHRRSGSPSTRPGASHRTQRRQDHGDVTGHGGATATDQRAASNQIERGRGGVGRPWPRRAPRRRSPGRPPARRASRARPARHRARRRCTTRWRGGSRSAKSARSAVSISGRPRARGAGGR